MNDFLRQRYFDFMNELAPIRNKKDDPETLEIMLLNLINIEEFSEAWSEDAPELYETLLATIEQFKAAGVAAYY